MQISNLNFPRHIFEKFVENLMKIRPVGAELFHKDRRKDRQIDMAKLIIAFRNFANAPNKWTTPMTRCQQNGTISCTARSPNLQCNFLFRACYLLLWRCFTQITFTEVSNKDLVLYKTLYRRKTWKRFVLRSRSEL
jgi:hypothetical protein